MYAAENFDLLNLWMLQQRGKIVLAYLKNEVIFLK